MFEVQEAAGVDAFQAPEAEAEFLENAGRGDVSDLDAGDDPAKSQFPESVFEEGAGGFRSEAAAPVRTSEREAQGAFAADRTRGSEVGIDAAISDVGVRLLEHGRLESEAAPGPAQVSPELALGRVAGARLAADKTADVGIRLDLAERVEVFGPVTSKEETFRFQDDHFERRALLTLAMSRRWWRAWSHSSARICRTVLRSPRPDVPMSLAWRAIAPGALRTTPAT